MKTSHRQSGRPASSTSTRFAGSALSRLASALPAEPPPTMTKSYRTSAMRQLCANRVPGSTRWELRAILCVMATQSRRGPTTAVYLEIGAKRVFACALDWPGWARSGRNELDACETLASYADRYAVAAARAGVAFPGPGGTSFEVVERLSGDATTDFGAPGMVPTHDADPLPGKDLDRVVALV